MMMVIDDGEECVPMAEAARRIGYTVLTFKTMRSRGVLKLDAVKIGTACFFKVSDVERARRERVGTWQ